jgi:hypothetical protein
MQTEDVRRKLKYCGYDPEILPDGARVGYVQDFSGIGKLGFYVSPDETVQDIYSETDGTLYEFFSCASHAYASADEVNKSDHDLFVEALDDIEITGEATFRLHIEVEEHEREYLGDRSVRLDYLTVNVPEGEDPSVCLDELLDQNDFPDGFEMTPARKLPNFNRDEKRLDNPDTSTSYVWVHTPEGSADYEILGRDRDSTGQSL